jgi:hypothetical protein
VLGLLALLVVVLWLALPSRLPALGLLGLITAGGLARFYGTHPVIARQWLTKAATFENGALALILLAALGLRFAGLYQSLPYFDNPDEPVTVNAAIKMLQTGDLNPHFFRWPSLPFYTQFLVSIPTFFAGVSGGTIQDLKTIPPESFIFAGRIVSALLGTLTIFLAFLIGRALYGSAAGLLGALILAVLPLHSEHSHYDTPDVMVTFCATMTLLFAVYIYRSGARRWYLWAGVATGLTLGAKYNVGVVLLTVVLAHFLTPSERRGRLSWLAATFGLTAGVFLLTTPFAVLDLPGFLNEMAFQVRHYTILGHGSASDDPSWSVYLYNFFDEAFVYQASLVVVGSILFALWRQRREDWLILSFPAIGYIFFSSARVHFSRNLLPLLPPLAILSAVFLLAIAGSLARLIKSRVQSSESRVQKVKLFSVLSPQSSVLSTSLALGLFVVFFAFAIQHSVLTDRYYLQPDTRREAGEWIVKNIPAGAKLRVEPETPILPAGRYAGADERRPVGARPLEWYQEQGYDYLIASSYYYNPLSDTDKEAAANYQALFQRTDRLVKEFPGDSRERPGPTIRIYKVK